MLKKILTTTALAVGIIALPAAASAEDGWQWRAFGGGSMPTDQDATFTLAPYGSLDADVSFDTGWVIGGAFGANRGSWTLEGELAYRTADAEVSFPGVALPPGYLSAEGEVNSSTFLVNAWYNFSLDAPINLYLGGGVGLGSIEIDDDISDFGAAWQVGGGLRFGGDGAIGYGIGSRYVALPAIDDQYNLAGGVVLATEIDEINAHELVFELTF